MFTSRLMGLVCGLWGRFFIFYIFYILLSNSVFAFAFHLSAGMRRFSVFTMFFNLSFLSTILHHHHLHHNQAEPTRSPCRAKTTPRAQQKRAKAVNNTQGETEEMKKLWRNRMWSEARTNAAKEINGKSLSSREVSRDSWIISSIFLCSASPNSRLFASSPCILLYSWFCYTTTQLRECCALEWFRWRLKRSRTAGTEENKDFFTLK